MVFVNEVDLWASGAELAEQREGTEGNAGEQHTCQTPSRQSVPHGLERVRLGFMIQEWQQTGRDDDFLLRGFELVPGAEVCTPQLLPPIQNKGNNLATSETDTNGYREPDNRDLCERD